MSPIAWALEPFKRYTDFRGRSRRREFWWYTLCLTVLAFVVFVAIGIMMGVAGLSQQAMSGILGILEVVWILVTIVPSVAVSVRRLHDTGRSGWWVLLAFVPLIGGLVLLVFECLDSQPGTNKWGTSPKSVGAVAVRTDIVGQS